jgi:hypothetical protein
MPVPPSSVEKTNWSAGVSDGLSSLTQAVTGTDTNPSNEIPLLLFVV